MNQLSGAETVVRLLQKLGVRHIFGLYGDTDPPLCDVQNARSARMMRGPTAQPVCVRLGTARPAMVDIVAQPLHEARAPVSEWVA